MSATYQAFRLWPSLLGKLLCLGLGIPLVVHAKNTEILSKQTQNPVQFSKLSVRLTDEELLNQARYHYEQGKLLQAIYTYKQIQDNSPLWVTAQEELAWTYYRMGDFESALSVTRSLTAFPLNQLPIYEAYLIKALSHMQLCQYSLVFATLTDFQKVKTEPLLELEKKAMQRKSNKVMEEWRLATEVVKKLKLVKIDTEQRLLRDHRDGLLIRSASAFDAKTADYLVFPDQWDEEPWLDEIGQFEVKSSKCVQKRRRL